MALKKALIWERPRLAEPTLGYAVQLASFVQGTCYAYLGRVLEFQSMSKVSSAPREDKVHPALDFDMERVQRSLESSQKKRITIPRGLSLEEMREFILKNK